MPKYDENLSLRNSCYYQINYNELGRKNNTLELFFSLWSTNWQEPNFF